MEVRTGGGGGVSVGFLGGRGIGGFGSGMDGFVGIGGGVVRERS